MSTAVSPSTSTQTPVVRSRRDSFTLPLATRRALLDGGELDPVRYQSDLIDYIRAADPVVRAFADWRPGDLERSDVPRTCTVTYKDTIDVAGFATRLGIRTGFRNYPHRSALIASRLSAQGLVCVGKAAVTECALGTERPSRNPVFAELSASGSSTGSAAAVAAGFCDVSVGTDSGGSIRWPAVYCGATALRLTSSPRWLAGVHTVSPSLESVGLVVRTPADLVWLWRTHRLGVALDAPPVAVPGRLRVGVSTPPGDPLHPEVAAMLTGVIRGLTRRGHLVRRPDLTSVWAHRPKAWELLSREANDSFGSLLDRKDVLLADDTRRAIRAGSATSDQRYADLLGLRHATRARFDALLSDDLDLLLIPLEAGLPDRAERHYDSTVPTAARDGSGDSVQPAAVDLTMTIVASFAGLPVLALPMGLSAAGAPIGLQVIARAHAEHLLVAVAELFADLADHDEEGRR